jgi:hypothetical protein
MGKGQRREESGRGQLNGITNEKFEWNFPLELFGFLELFGL